MKRLLPASAIVAGRGLALILESESVSPMTMSMLWNVTSSSSAITCANEVRHARAHVDSSRINRNLAIHANRQPRIQFVPEHRPRSRPPTPIASRTFHSSQQTPTHLSGRQRQRSARWRLLQKFAPGNRAHGFPKFPAARCTARSISKCVPASGIKSRRAPRESASSLRMRHAIQKRLRVHNHPIDAIAALRRLLLAKCLLNGMHMLRRTQTFQRHHVFVQHGG